MVGEILRRVRRAREHGLQMAGKQTGKTRTGVADRAPRSGARLSEPRSGARLSEPRSGIRIGTPRSGMAPALLMAGAVSVLALPSAVLAFSTRIDLPAAGIAANQDLNGFAPGSVDPRLARVLAASPTGGKGPLFRFTPAGLATRPDRLVTVAVRVDPVAAGTIIVRGAIDRINRPTPAMVPGLASLAIAPAAYNLGVAHGYQGFAQNVQTYALAQDIHKIDMPDLSTFQPATDPGGAPSRLAPHIALDEHDRTGRAPRTLESVGTQTVDVGGSYRLSRNIDVTAGVRYERDRDRLDAQIDGKTDTQAVFVGTQFKF